MSNDDERGWSGYGKWLSFAVAALLILLSIPLILLNAAAAGWNIFLALLLIGTVGSGHKKAPLVAMIVSAVMAIRLAAAVGTGAMFFDTALAALLVGLAGTAAYHLRRQETSA